MKDIFHPRLNRSSPDRIGEDIKSFVTDGPEDNIGCLMWRYSSLHSLTHELHQGLTFGTLFLFIWIILEFDQTIAICWAKASTSLTHE